MNIKKLFFSFTIIVMIFALSAIFTIVKMQELTENTQKMYIHPFKVSNAVASIQTSIITMHRNMKDVVLTPDTLEMIKIIESIQEEENKVYEYFTDVYTNYLGNKKDIDILYDSFKSWKIIRSEVITLVYQNKLKEAIDITKGKGKEHIDNLYTQIDVLKKYAFNKADEFYNISVKENGVGQVISVFFFSIFVSGVIVVFMVINLLKINRSNNKQLYLIDQNILTASISLDTEVLDISNALCRSLYIQKTDILNTKNQYFFTNEVQFMKFRNIIYSAKEYKAEIYIEINDTKVWFFLEIFPQLDHNFKLTSFNLFLTNIDNKKKIEQVSITDTLTGLYNRNYFEMIFEKEVKRSKRDEKPLSMIMLDIDCFKQFNDTYGHHDGDIALKSVSHILSAHTNRSYDYAFRIGGEEFMILSYQKDFTQLQELAGNILKEIESLKIPHQNNFASEFVTISAGVIQFGVKHLLSPDEMYKKIDELLYKAKKDGRNKFKSLLIE
ncbi:diguanylate cyclase [Sulfurimonas sp.]|uniref:diguanylate cyclase n=1 Tax=Sulfurimonas sp. TaxID=2022749 RepID=UPI002AB274DF|nr:diguanylate cyclase [Sulfurimonas sp.]